MTFHVWLELEYESDEGSYQTQESVKLLVTEDVDEAIQALERAEQYYRAMAWGRKHWPMLHRLILQDYEKEIRDE